MYGKLSEAQSDSPPVRDSNLEAVLVFKGINFPTSMAFLDEGDILVLEKNNGQVKRIVDGRMLPEPILDLNVANQAEQGMLGIAVAKHSTESISVFLLYTEAKSYDGGKAIGNRLYRYELESDRLVHPKLLIDLPAYPGPIHNGGKITIGPDANIYLTIGDLKGSNPQQSRLFDGRSGIIRIGQDGNTVGSIFGENPPFDKYFAYGIRNS